MTFPSGKVYLCITINITFIAQMEFYWRHYQAGLTSLHSFIEGPPGTFEVPCLASSGVGA